MGRCCGGKNAGKPISRGRWLVGRAIFLGYHLVIECLILPLSLFSPTVRNLGRFHRQYMGELWRQIRDLDGIKVGQAPARAAAAETRPAAGASSTETRAAA